MRCIHHILYQTRLHYTGCFGRFYMHYGISFSEIIILLLHAYDNEKTHWRCFWLILFFPVDTESDKKQRARELKPSSGSVLVLFAWALAWQTCPTALSPAGKYREFLVLRQFDASMTRLTAITAPPRRGMGRDTFPGSFLWASMPPVPGPSPVSWFHSDL